jgi:diadenosine tetraphosphatase ApaH/serine/threonine PP2A family protein phosphatase
MCPGGVRRKKEKEVTVRYAILGDVHGNLQALEAVLERVDEDSVDCILCVGDLVGYGADPGECIRIIQERATVVVAGNHDCGAVGRMELTYFNVDACDAIRWTMDQISEEQYDYLEELALTAEVNGLLLVHSTPHFPEEFAYIQTLYDASLAFQKLKTEAAFVGHSHVPAVLIDTDPIQCFMCEECQLPFDHRLIVNVGSVGQPRDLDPRASYAVFDADERKLFMRRVEYDIEVAADAILEAGLPETNANRLFWGR